MASISVLVRMNFVCNRKLRNSNAIASRKGPHCLQLFSEYGPVSTVHLITKQIFNTS
jgi:hypothetical protein